MLKNKKKPKVGLKKLTFRIFCELNAKMSCRSLITTGFSDPTVEMREARHRALTQTGRHSEKCTYFVEMREARHRALTRFLVMQRSYAP